MFKNFYSLQLFEIPITKDYHEMDAAKKRRMKWLTPFFLILN